MSANLNRLKEITFSIDSITTFNCQIKQWNITNNTPDPEKIYTFCADGETRDEPDDDYVLELTFFSDWATNGFSEFTWVNDKEIVDFVLDHMTDVAAQHVRWTGQVQVKAVSAGGEARTNEEHSVTWAIIGKPVFVDNATVSV